MSKSLETLKLFYTGLMNEIFAAVIPATVESIGSWDLNIGDSQISYLGSRYTCAFGSDDRLVISPFSWLMGPGRRSPITDFILGLGDDVTMCYGGRTTATFGGPATTIVRGPRITKTGSTTDIMGGLKADAVNPLNALYKAEDKGEKDEKGLKDDSKVGKVVTLLSACLTAVTAIIDLWAHFQYEVYDPKKGRWTIENPANDLSTQLGRLQIAHRYLPRRIMALIYHFETAAAWKHTGDDLLKHFQGFALKFGALLLTITTFGLGLGLAYGIVKAGITGTTAVVLFFVFAVFILIGLILLCALIG